MVKKMLCDTKTNICPIICSMENHSNKHSNENTLIDTMSALAKSSLGFPWNQIEIK